MTKLFPPVFFKGIKDRIRMPKVKNEVLEDILLQEKQILLNETDMSPVLVSSAHGRIKTIVFHYPSMIKEKENDEIGGLHIIIRKLAASMKYIENIIVVTNYASFTFEIEALLKREIGDKVHVCKVMPYKCCNFSNWASDPYKAIFYKDNIDVPHKLYLVEPDLIHIANGGDLHIIDYMLPHIEEHKSDPHLTLDALKQKSGTGLRLDGGNMLVGDTFVLLGGDIEKENNDEISKALLKKMFFGNKTSYYLKGEPPKHYFNGDKTIFNTTIDKVKNIFATETFRGGSQPMYHIDLFITLGGRAGNGQYQLVVGQPVPGFTIDELLGMPSDLRGIIYEQLYKMEYSISSVIKQLGSILNKEKNIPEFKIIRSPLPLTYHTIEEEDCSLTRKWYWATYNNCIVEIDKDSKSVWLPSYLDDYSDYENPESDKKEIYGNWKNLEEHENEVRRVWKEELGFKNITFIEANFHMYIQKRGSLACLVNCIERETEDLSI